MVMADGGLGGCRLKGGVTDDLIRFSVGIEDVEEIMADLAQVLRPTFAGKCPCSA